MKMTSDGKGVVTITLTHDQLGIVRYALDEGVGKLRATASFFKTMGYGSAVVAAQTARKAKAASDALEKAVQQWVRKRTKPEGG